MSVWPGPRAVSRVDGPAPGGRPPRVLVLGGARSGKSTWAEQRLAQASAVTYLATSARDPDDAEWEERVRVHQARRPAHWRTVESLDLARVLLEDDDSPVLVDCLAVWLARVLDQAGAWPDEHGARGSERWAEHLDRQVETLLDGLRRTEREVVLVSNEVGLGVVPETASGRLYRDQLGRLNALVAGVCDEVWLCLAGIARRWA